MSQSQRFAGQAAIVTGASKGIGASIARQLAAEGAAVVVNYASSRSGADQVVGAIRDAGGRALAVQADLSSEPDVVRLFEEAHREFGRLDVLINNAGIYEFSPLEEITKAHFEKQFNLNVLGLLLASREAARRFGPEGGSIVNVSSVVSTYTPPNAAVYAATKAAVDAITLVLSKELGPRRIRVNSVNPGMVETEGVRTAGLMEGDSATQVAQSTPLGRIGQPDDIAPVAAFLASRDAGWMTGETLVVAGGFR
ncbi:MAG: glucose 1-dehydrogenase [Planctomyces sp.]|nr:glucose 1-dehydrogenase [Planctomyces sp.]